MKSIIIHIIIILVVTFRVMGQEKSQLCNCSVLLDPEFKGSIDVLKNPGGDRLQSIKHNLKGEDLVTFEVKQKAQGYFFVTADYFISGHIVDGWIKANDAFGIYVRGYSPGDSLRFRTAPAISAKTIVVVKGYMSKLLPVIDCNPSGWVKVRFRYDGRKYEGWLAPEDQCANPYTTCS